MKTTRFGVLAAVVLLVAAGAAGATGLLMPSEKDLPPLGIKNHRVSAHIKDGVAVTKLTEVFLNSTGRRLEATYVFPIPADAALTDFALYVNGKRQSGEIVEAEKARRIYEDIVRRMRDPGLLEYMGGRLLRMRVFPIEPRSTQKVEVSYACALPFDNGVYRYSFPLKTGEKASRVLEDSTFSAEITSTRAIANIYSPTHKVGVSRKGDHRAIVGFEEEGAMLDRDFLLYFSVAEKDFGLNLLTHRLEGEEGYFALMLAPRLGIEEQDVMPKDVCFLLDTSGSMGEQNRIESAREAVKSCLKSLRRDDRFALVRFSTAAEAFEEGLMQATEQNVEMALAYVETLEARGGTALCGALLKGLEMAPEGERPYLLVLVTDGKPTIGTVEPDAIVEEVRKANKKNVRVFSFGIAESLDVPLLDSITETTRGYSEYVAPGREIETAVSSFFRKVSHPVLAGLEVEFGRVKVSEMYPRELPDLFRGSQVLVFGRYSGSAEVAVRLTGTIKGERREFAYDAAFPETTPGNDFIPHLWAQRKIAYLLDEIRLHGENEELVDEVVRLSTEYGIATPYTSYLVLEDEDAYVRHGIVRAEALSAAERFVPRGRAAATKEREDLRGAFLRQRRLEETRAFVKDFVRAGGVGRKVQDEAARSGPGAVRVSRTLRRWKEARRAGEGGLSAVRTRLRKAGDKTFVQLHGVFVDTEFKEGMKELKLKWGSDAYFAALRALPELKDYLALGEDVIVVIEGKALIVAEDGEEELREEDLRAFFGM